MQVCTLLQTDNLGRMPFLLPNQQRQSTEGSTEVAAVLIAKSCIAADN